MCICKRTSANSKAVEQHPSQGYGAIRYRSWDLKHQSDLDYYSLFRRNLTNVISFPFCSLLPLCTFFSLVFKSYPAALHVSTTTPLVSHSPQGLLPSLPISSTSMFSSVAGSGNYLCKCPVAGSVEGRLREGRAQGLPQGRLSFTLMVSKHSGL